MYFKCRSVWKYATDSPCLDGKGNLMKNLPALALASMLILSGCDRLGIGNPFSGKGNSAEAKRLKRFWSNWSATMSKAKPSKLLTTTHSKTKHLPISAYRISAEWSNVWA